MWQTMADVWRAAKQLPNSEVARWMQLLASVLIVVTAIWQTVAKVGRWLCGDGAKKQDHWEPPEGA